MSQTLHTPRSSKLTCGCIHCMCQLVPVRLGSATSMTIAQRQLAAPGSAVGFRVVQSSGLRTRLQNCTILCCKALGSKTGRQNCAEGVANTDAHGMSRYALKRSSRHTCAQHDEGRSQRRHAVIIHQVEVKQLSSRQAEEEGLHTSELHLATGCNSVLDALDEAPADRVHILLNDFSFVSYLLHDVLQAHFVCRPGRSLGCDAGAHNRAGRLRPDGISPSP